METENENSQKKINFSISYFQNLFIEKEKQHQEQLLSLFQKLKDWVLDEIHATFSKIISKSKKYLCIRFEFCAFPNKLISDILILEIEKFLKENGLFIQYKKIEKCKDIYEFDLSIQDYSTLNKNEICQKKKVFHFDKENKLYKDLIKISKIINNPLLVSSLLIR